MLKTVAAVVGMLAVLSGFPATAQKSKDTVRIPILEPLKGLDYYGNPNPELEFAAISVLDTLIYYDDEAKRYAPLLAKSWSRIDAKTVEFELHQDIVWHDGQKFDADDVIDTISWGLDPETKFRSKRDFEWIAKIEKLGPYKIRITSVAPSPVDEVMLATTLPILPKHIHGKLPLNNKNAYYNKPIGTGMFSVTDLNDNTGIFLKKNDKYRHGGQAKAQGNIGNMHLVMIPDNGARMAQFLAGNLDMLVRQEIVDQVEFLAKRPNVKLVVGEGPTMTFLALDARGRAGNAALTDKRVRTALFMALDRRELAKIEGGDRDLPPVPGALCFKDQMGCDYSFPMPPYDPAGAKKLLAEAGYPNGLEIELSTYNNVIANYAVAVSGQLSKIGVKADIKKHTIAAHRLAERDNKVQAMAGAYPIGKLPDVTRVLNFIYNTPTASDYHGDQKLKDMAEEMDTILDPIKRRELGRRVFDRATEEAYFMPLAVRPAAIVLLDSLEVKVTRHVTLGFQPGGLNWIK